MQHIDLSVLEAIIVDGHVFVGNNKTFGLGGHLWEVLDKKTSVIGITKRAVYNTEKVVTSVYRGQSQNPLYVSCVGVSKEELLSKVKSLHGAYRMPTLLKLLDQHTKKD